MYLQDYSTKESLVSSIPPSISTNSIHLQFPKSEQTPASLVLSRMSSSVRHPSSVNMVNSLVLACLHKRLAKRRAHDEPRLKSQSLENNQEYARHDKESLDVDLDQTNASLPVE